MTQETKVIVIGGGSSGLATAAELRRRGVPSVVLERSSAVGAAWARRYDRLRLNSGRPFSRLPRGRHAKGTPMFPLRDDVVRYLGAYAERHRVDVRTHVRVDRIDRTPQGWVVCTSDGDLEAEHVVVATGYDHTGLLPDWPGRADYTRPLVHAAEYRNPEPYRDRDVLVVGPGCTGAEVAYDLVTGGASRVRLAVRTPPNILIRTPVGVLLARTFMKLPPARADAILRRVRLKEIGDLTEFGLPIPQEGVFSRLRRLGVAPMIVDKEVIDAIKEGRIEIVAGVASFDEDGVGLADGSRIEPDAVIAATGYRCGLEDIVGHLGVLDERGIPAAHAEAPAARGLRFVGFIPIPGHFAYGGAQARQAAKAIAHELRGRAPRPAAVPAPPVTAGCA